MKYCSKCGTQLEDDAIFCCNCGERTEPVKEVAPEVPAVSVTQSPVSYPEPAAPASAYYDSGSGKGYAEPPRSQVHYTIARPIISLALGICALTFAWLGIYSFIGLIDVAVCIAGLIVSSKAAITNPGSNMAAHGRRMSIAALIICVILILLFTFVWGSLIGSAL